MNGPAYDKAYSFALEVVHVCSDLSRRKREYVLSRQLLRCGTAIAANLAEAGGAGSQGDLSFKASIAYKECCETRYWLMLLRDTEKLDAPTCERMIAQVEEVMRILFATLRTLGRAK